MNKYALDLAYIPYSWAGCCILPLFSFLGRPAGCDLFVKKEKKAEKLSICQICTCFFGQKLYNSKRQTTGSGPPKGGPDPVVCTDMSLQRIQLCGFGGCVRTFLLVLLRIPAKSAGDSVKIYACFFSQNVYNSDIVARTLVFLLRTHRSCAGFVPHRGRKNL